jgi:D-alanyl-D-alanine carboxypeptidase
VKPRPQLQTSDIVELHRDLHIPPDYALSRRLAPQREAEVAQLVTISVREDREIHLIGPAATAWRSMHAAAHAANVTLLPLSGFRSVARQAEILRAKLTAGHSIEAILSVVAAPGYSEHHTGRALDIGTPDSEPFDECFGEMEAFTWLTAHAASFQFTLSYPRNNPHGIIYEPWHWCWQNQ